MVNGYRKIYTIYNIPDLIWITLLQNRSRWHFKGCKTCLKILRKSLIILNKKKLENFHFSY